MNVPAIVSETRLPTDLRAQPIAAPSRLNRLFNAVTPSYIQEAREIFTTAQLCAAWAPIPFAVVSTAIGACAANDPYIGALSGAAIGVMGFMSPLLSKVNAQVRFNRLCQDQTKDKVIVVVSPAKVPFTDFALGIKGESYSAFKTLSEKYSIVQVKVETISEVNPALQKIRDAGREIKSLVFNAHGEPNGFHLGHDEFTGWVTTDSFLTETPQQINYKLLDPSASIVLMSCSTGQDMGPDEINIAESFQAACEPGQQVYAPSEALTADHAHLANAETCQFDFYESFRGKLLKVVLTLGARNPKKERDNPFGICNVKTFCPKRDEVIAKIERLPKRKDFISMIGQIFGTSKEDVATEAPAEIVPPIVPIKPSRIQRLYKGILSLGRRIANLVRSIMLFPVRVVR